jgi:hypothetical protein
MLPLVCVSLLMIIGILGIYSFKELGRWWGYPLALSGLVPLGISLLAEPAAEFATTRLIPDSIKSTFSPQLIETGSELGIAVIRALFTQVRNYSLVVFGMGLAVIISASVLGPSAKKSVQDQEIETEPDQEEETEPGLEDESKDDQEVEPAPGDEESVEDDSQKDSSSPSDPEEDNEADESSDEISTTDPDLSEDPSSEEEDTENEKDPDQDSD